ncbi:hypothetical protein LDK09_07790 [Fusobacterium animalis]|uniref:hypothetical protein n=1 Tax=Fusobacterium TaxID=848 RepID=UPI0030CB6C72
MAIIKIIKRDCPYVTIDKTGVDDPNLSWAATGLLTYLIGRPGNWKINITHLSSVKTCKETATKSALKELREANYCHYFVVRKNGKISETFYLVFEVPTNYEEVLENYIDLKEGETILYQPVKIGKNTENKTKKKAPQVENQLMGKNIENKEVIPQVENPLVENLIAENQGLLIKDTTNNRITNNKTTTSENKKSSSSLKENSLEKETINKLLKKYSLSKITRKNILSLYSKKLITKERIMEVFEISKEKKWGEGAIFKALKENWNIQSKNTTKDITVLSEDEARKKIRNRVNYYINVFETNNNFDEAKNNFIEELKQINGFEDLKSEYLEKFEDYVNNKKNIKEEENKNNFDSSIERFLNLSEELQEDITKKAEILYSGSSEILNQLKRKSSNNFYLKMIWVEILKTIEKEYPEIDIVGMKGEVR